MKNILFKKFILIYIITIISFLSFQSGKCNNSIDLKDHLFFEKNLFLFSLLTYFYYNENELIKQTKHLYYKNKIIDFFEYINKKYKFEIEQINKLYYGKNFNILIKHKGNLDLKNNRIISTYYNLHRLNLEESTNSSNLPIYNYFNIIRKDKKYIKLINFIQKDANNFFIKGLNDLNTFLKKRYNTTININNTKIYYSIFYNFYSNVFLFTPISFTVHEYKYSTITLSNIYDYSFVIELMHILYNEKFYKNDGDKYLEKYDSKDILKKLFNFEFKEIKVTNTFDDIFSTVSDYSIFYETNKFYDELFGNLFFFYYLKQTGKIQDYFYRKGDVLSILYFNLLRFRSFGYYCYNFFPEYRGKNVIKDFIKYVYNLKLQDIKEAYKNINTPINSIINNISNCYFVNLFKDKEMNPITKSIINNYLKKTKYSNIKILNRFDRITYGINITKLEKGVYKINPKLIVLCSLNYPEFKDISTLTFLSKYKSREYFVKLRDMYLTKEFDKLDYVILSYLDSMIFIYFRNIEQLPKILNKLRDINYDHYFKYK